MRKRVRRIFVLLSFVILLKILNTRSDYGHSSKWEKLEFNYCQTLSNAVFDEDAYINAFKGSLKQVDPSVDVFVNLVDNAGNAHFELLKKSMHGIDLESAKRLACYFAVSSRVVNSGWNYTVSRTPCNYKILILVLKHVDAKIYFPFLTINQDIVKTTQIDLHARVFDPSKKRYKIAYFIMAHDKKECLITMMDALYSTEGIYLIHIDANYPEFKQEIVEWVDRSMWDNVRVMDKSFFGQWGGSSLVFIELEGFFQLLQMAEWDYVINLSAHDYPLANTSTIHHILQITPGRSYIGHWAGNEETFRRLSCIAIRSNSKKEIVIDYAQPRQFTLGDRFFPMIQTQWMVSPIN
jgi:hypothetical protein